MPPNKPSHLSNTATGRIRKYNETYKGWQMILRDFLITERLYVTVKQGNREEEKRPRGNYVVFVPGRAGPRIFRDRTKARSPNRTLVGDLQEILIRVYYVTCF